MNLGTEKVPATGKLWRRGTLVYTTPALVMVGFLMVSSISEIDFFNLPEAIPAYMCIIAMPFTYSISEGISFGIISYVLVNTLTGHAKRVSPLMYILALIFILKYVLI